MATITMNIVRIVEAICIELALVYYVNNVM
jgi:hypothetical protein